MNDSTSVLCVVCMCVWCVVCVYVCVHVCLCAHVLCVVFMCVPMWTCLHVCEHTSAYILCLYGHPDGPCRCVVLCSMWNSTGTVLVICNLSMNRY